MRLKKEKKLAFHFENTSKDTILTKKDEGFFTDNNICRFCEKTIESDEFRDHCPLTGKYRNPAHNECYNNVTQKQNIFIPIVFDNFSNF